MSELEVLRFAHVIGRDTLCFDAQVGGRVMVVTREEILRQNPRKLVEFYERTLHMHLE